MTNDELQDEGVNPGEGATPENPEAGEAPAEGTPEDEGVDTPSDDEGEDAGDESVDDEGEEDAGDKPVDDEEEAPLGDAGNGDEVDDRDPTPEDEEESEQA